MFKYPEEPDRDFIKRVIGLPGETLELREKKVYINGTPLDEPYVHFLEPPPRPSESARSHLVRRPRALRAGHGAARSVLRDGRQPRQLAGQPLLGLPAARLHQGQGAGDLLVVRCGAADYQDEGAGATVKGLGSVFAHFFTRTRWDRMLHQIR